MQRPPFASCSAKFLKVFDEVAVRLAGLTGAVLGWRPGEFWSATPAELAAILSALAPESDSADADMVARLKEQHPDG